MISSIPRWRKATVVVQLSLALSILILLALLCYAWLPQEDYRLVALILLLCNSLLGVWLRPISAFILAATSALVWNFFFIPPVFTFHIADAHDALMFLMYFSVAATTSYLQHKIRRDELKALEHEKESRSLLLYNAVFNSLSHELRTPITTIIGVSDVLINDRKKISETDTDGMFADIQESAFRLQNQVNGLLAMGRLESGQFKPRLDWTDVQEIAFRSVEPLRNELHRIEFEYPQDLPLFYTDATLLEHILLNLIKNALQYSPSHCTVRVIVSNDHENIICKVEDQGDGIPESERDLMFERFQRGASAKPGGLGLGLSIVKGFTQALGGRVDYTTVSAEFTSIFTVHIPAKMSFINALSHE